MSTPLIQRQGLHRVDTNLLLSTGAMEGPYRTTRPVVRGWLSALWQFLNQRSPFA